MAPVTFFIRVAPASALHRPPELKAGSGSVFDWGEVRWRNPAYERDCA